MAESAGGVPGSRQAVRALLAELGLHAHKRFGQNFLADRGVLDRIVEIAAVGPSSVVLEVGPGLGTLTGRLLARGAAVVAAEIDHGLSRHLRGVFADAREFTLVEGDAMGRKGRLSEAVASAVRAAIARRGAPGFEVVSNLPYGISSPFLTSLAFAPGPPLRTTVMLQLEMARVLCAQPGSEDYSALSVFVRSYFDVRKELEVGRHAFFPEPDVDSAVVSLVPAARGGPDPEAFSGFVKTLFQSRRKAIGTSVGAMLGTRSAASGELLRRSGLDPGARVDGLSPDAIAGLFRAVAAAPPLS